MHDIARANILAAKSDVTDEVFNVASGTRNQPAGTCRDAARASWDRPLEPQHAEARKVNGVTAPAGRHQQGEQASRLRGRDLARGRAPRPGRLVASESAPHRCGGRAMNVSRSHASGRQAVPRRARGRRRPARHPVRMGHAGARSRGVRARIRRVLSARRTPARFRTARRRFTWRCAPSASGPATKSSPSAIRSSPRRTPSAIAAPCRSLSTSRPTASTSIRR